MSKLLVNLALLPAKALITGYTWSTLPLYAIVQKPWNRLKLSKSFGISLTLDDQNRLVYSRPYNGQSTSKQVYECNSFAEAVANLDRTREVIGIRDVISEQLALDEQGKIIRVDGRDLKKVKLADKFRWLNVGTVLDRVDSIARGLSQIGVSKGDKVCIYAENSFEWFCTALALTRLQAVTVTLFSTLGDSGVVHGTNQSDAPIMVTSQNLLSKVLGLGDQLINLRNIIYFANPREAFQVPESKFSIITLEALEELGQKGPPCDYGMPHPDDLTLIMMTSGTSSTPKGVMISHKQLFTSVRNMMNMDEEYGEIGANSQHCCYLPLGHIFQYVVNMALFSTKGRFGFCSPFTLLDSSPSHVPGQVGDIRLIQPAYFVAVPLVLERILKEIYRKLNERGKLAESLFTYLMDYKIRWTARGFQTPLINWLICQKINDQFGGRLKMIGVSSAPLHKRTQGLIEAALNVKINLAYGATENVGPCHACHINDLSLGSVGVPYSSFKYYLKDWREGGYSTSDRPSPRGEIVLAGDSIASGYYNMAEETESTFTVDADGTRWYHTGDIGQVSPTSMTVSIIDRKKDLTKLANGEFVALGKIESALRQCNFVENICVCTDPYSNHVTALISPNRQALSELAATLGKSSLTFEKLCDELAVVAQVHQSLTATGQKLGLKAKEIPAQVTLVPEEWTPATGILTAAFKLKRKAVYEAYRHQIINMFEIVNCS